MKFVATQIGARRGYAVPEIFERAGMLERFYTDMCGSVGLGASLASLQSVPWIGARMTRLAARQISQSVRGKTRTFGGVVCRGALRGVFADRDAVSRFRNHMRFDQDLGRAMIRAGYGEATHVFSMLAEASPFLIDDGGHIAGADLLPPDQSHLGRLDHGIRRFDHRDEALGLDHAECFTHCAASVGAVGATPLLFQLSYRVFDEGGELAVC